MDEKAIKTHCSFEKTFEYILSIANTPHNDLPLRVMQNWNIITPIAEQMKINGYLAPWVLNTWGVYCDPEMRYHLIGIIFRNKLRNQKMIEQIYRLSALFDTHDVPILFLKGATGLVQNLYPTESRFLADIDILVKVGYMQQGEMLLIANGYVLDDSVRVPVYHHHIALYRHPEYPGTVELHHEPYDASMLDRPVMPEIWEHAQCLKLNGQNISVPSMDDHIWITMRSHGYSKATLPRFHEAMELLVILQAGHHIDFNLLRRRCAKDMIPGLLDGVLYTMHRYFGIEPPKPYHVSDSWKHWSDNMNRTRLGAGVKETAPERRFGCLYFLNNHTFYRKLLLFKKMVHYEVQEDMAVLHIRRSHSNVILAYRYVRDALLLVMVSMKYVWRVTMK